MRNKVAQEGWFKHLPADATDKLKKFYLYSKGVTNAIGAAPRNGVTGTISKRFEMADTLAERVLSGDIPTSLKFAGNAASMLPLGVGRGVRTLQGAGKTVLEAASGGKASDRMGKGIDMIATPEFQALAKDYAARKMASDLSVKRAEEVLKKSEKYNRWAMTLNPAERALLKSAGPFRALSYWASFKNNEE